MIAEESLAPPTIPEQTPEDETNVFTAGVFLIDKPVGPSSFRIIQYMRRILGMKKVGHAGTLDPFASGLLIVCAGRPATRIIEQLMGGNKEYVARLKLGTQTDTHDLEGKVTAVLPVPDLSRNMIDNCLAGFAGVQMQIPPRFSALKHEGKPLYYYARKGIEVVKEARRVEIIELACQGFGADFIDIRVLCTKGTYIRTLAADIGESLGCGAHLVSLRRLASGPFSVTGALPGDQLGRGGDVTRETVVSSALTIEEALASQHSCTRSAERSEDSDAASH